MMCKTCGKTFTYAKSWIKHQERCALSSLAQQALEFRHMLLDADPDTVAESASALDALARVIQICLKDCRKARAAG